MITVPSVPKDGLVLVRPTTAGPGLKIKDDYPDLSLETGQKAEPFTILQRAPMGGDVD